MKNYIGIDLGTTNSAICSFDGEHVRLYKSPEQNDVTPSAIYIAKRGGKYIGSRAYENAARDPDSAAILFKRLIGTKTVVKLSAANLTMTPEECSAEILKALFGYLPEEIRSDPETGIVITVPAAFNQMQKDATIAAAEMAGLGKVALMQEPVAAVMSVMRHRKGDGVFLVYDLGGGTLDVAIAQSTAGRVSLLSHSGVAMCGGRDFDRILLENVVKPWLATHFQLPNDWAASDKYKKLRHYATWSAEKAKIELSAKESSVISASEAELGTVDLKGQEIYLDIPLDRAILNELIAPKIEESIGATREALEKAGLTAHDIERMVFVGGPTQYKPLRDKAAFELGIAASTDVNPMTAVAEGAAVFAESIDWSSQSRGRKSSRGTLSSTTRMDLSFAYVARTPDSRAKIAAKINGTALSGAEFQIDSPDTGWSSGRVALRDGAAVEVSLPKPGENLFKIWVFDGSGAPLAFENNRLTITRTAATIDAIPSSSSIGIEALEKLGGSAFLKYLVRDGDALPKKGKERFKAGESLRAGSSGSLNLKLWEGDIPSPISDNRFVGTLRINGSDFDDGVIPAGADLECEYEVLDSGQVVLAVSVPCIGATFHVGRNFYSRQEGQVDLGAAAKLIRGEAETIRNRVDALCETVTSDKLDQAHEKIDEAESIAENERDPETAKRAMDNMLEAKKLLAQVRKEHLKPIRHIDLQRCTVFFDEHVREHARPSESAAFDNLTRTAQRSIDKNDNEFENLLDQLKSKNFQILWRQDWFVLERFKYFSTNAQFFPDQQRFAALVATGTGAIKADDLERLRTVTAELDSIRIGTAGEDEMLASTNVVAA